MAAEHPEPTGEAVVPTYEALDPVMSVGGIASYFGVSRQLAMKWTRESPDFPAPFARPQAGAVYLTGEVIAWGKRHERQRGEGPRAAGDPRPPSARTPKTPGA